MKKLEEFELRQILAGENDRNAFVTIHSGAGGTESCDWADMLLRMYQRWFERSGFRARPIEIRRVKKPASNRHAPGDRRIRLRLAAIPSAACIGWCAFRRSTRRSGGTPRLPAWTSSRKSRTPRRSKSTGGHQGRNLPFRRQGRTEREQGRDCGADDARADRCRRRLPGRAQPGKQPRRR